MPSQRKPYSGEKKLVIGFDVGTTFSGVSYALLIPWVPPDILGVAKFPGQQETNSNFKIPSVVCYDGRGNVVAVGSEADVDMYPDLLETEGLVTAEWFKLHLRPSHLVAEQGFNVKTIPPLPPNKMVVEIFADLLHYLHKSTEKYIRERHGDNMWEAFGANADIILSHPNGWEGKQQSEIRRAAIMADLVKDEIEALDRISFVTEGEASLHFCLNNISSEEKIAERAGITVVDCGGGTIDISSYMQSPNGRFREITRSECLLQGSFFVTQRAREFLTDKLRTSRFSRDIDAMARNFDEKTKLAFNTTSRQYLVRFGQRENDPRFDIRNGAIKISGEQIAEFFEPAVQSIIRAIEKQSRDSVIPIKTIFMVGGFATSDYLFAKLEKHFKARNMTILRPDAYLNKAVAEGAVSFKIDHAVISRVARYTYGIDTSCKFNAKNPDHIKRQHTRYEGLDGVLRVPNAFSTILIKDTEVSEETEFRESFGQIYSKSEFSKLTICSSTIKCYRNRQRPTPSWIDMEPDLFPDLCQITADVSGVKKSIQCQISPKGVEYYRLNYDVVLLFGLTQLRAQIAWIEDGKEKRGPTSIVYT